MPNITQEQLAALSPTAPHYSAGEEIAAGGYDLVIKAVYPLLINGQPRIELHCRKMRGSKTHLVHHDCIHGVWKSELRFTAIGW